jgi:hypothetical protein
MFLAFFFSLSWGFVVLEVGMFENVTAWKNLWI